MNANINLIVGVGKYLYQFIWNIHFDLLLNKKVALIYKTGHGVNILPLFITRTYDILLTAILISPVKLMGLIDQGCHMWLLCIDDHPKYDINLSFHDYVVW